MKAVKPLESLQKISQKNLKDEIKEWIYDSIQGAVKNYCRIILRTMTEDGLGRRDLLKAVGSIPVAVPDINEGQDADYEDLLESENYEGSEIAAENMLEGDTGWEPDKLQDGIEAYTTTTSVEPGDELELCVSASNPYNVEIYRMGWYDGDGGRRLESFSGAAPRKRPEKTYSGPHDMVRCDWDVTDTVNIPDDWVSGLYYSWVKEETGDAAYGHPFVVKNSESSADIAVQLPLATQQAYNGWPGPEKGGKSLYGFASDGPRGSAVSHDRPYLNPFDHHLNYATHFIRWLESEGYDVEYLDDLDVHQEPERLKEHEAVVSAGHDEYWSLNQHDAFWDARDAGVDLAFIGANISYWRVFYEDDGRYFICGKDEEDDLFRNIGRHEARLMGQASFGYQKDGNYTDMKIDPEGLDHPYMEDTGFETGDRLTGIVGHEWAWIHPESPDELTRFFHYEEGSQMEDVVTDNDADTVTFEADSGATVFHCGTTSWPWRLDPDAGWDQEHPFDDARRHNPEVADPHSGLQQLQRNVFDDFLNE